MGNSLGKHGLASAGGAVQQHPPGGVNANLSVQLVVRQRQFHGFLDLLLLDVITSNVLHTDSTLCRAQDQCIV